MVSSGIATTHDLVLKLRDRGFSMYTEQQMDEQYGWNTSNCWVLPLNKCLCASDILGRYDAADKDFYDKYIDSIWSDEREYYLRPVTTTNCALVIDEYSIYKNGTYKIGHSVFGIPSLYKDDQLVAYSDLDLIIEVKIKHSRIVDSINMSRDVIMCTEMPTEQEYYAFQTNGNWNRIVLHWVNDSFVEGTQGYYVTYYPLSMGLRIGLPKSNSALGTALPDLTNTPINCYWLDGNQYVGYTPKLAFTGNVYIGGYFMNGTL